MSGEPDGGGPSPAVSLLGRLAHVAPLWNLLVGATILLNESFSGRDRPTAWLAGTTLLGVGASARVARGDDRTRPGSGA